MNHDDPCPHRLHDLIRWRFGELSASDAARVEYEVSTCEHCQARLVDLDTEQARFLASVNPGAQSAAILARLEAPPVKAPWWTPIKRPQIIATLAALILVPTMLSVGPQSSFWSETKTPQLRTKGSPSIKMYVNAPSGAQPAYDGIRLSAGDQIQFRYAAYGRRYLWILSVDSNHAINPLYPEEPGRSLAVSPQGTHTLEGSIILDNARGPERIYAIFSKTPLAFSTLESAVKEQLRRHSVANLPKILLSDHPQNEQITLLIMKE